MDLDPSMENVCRVCRDGSVTLVDIFNGVDAEEDHEKNLAHVLSQCTNCQVNPDDLLPKQICLSCVLAAQNAFRFKKTCEQSHQYFCEILEMRWQTQHRSQAEELVFNDDDVHMAGGLHVIDVSCIKMEPMSELQELAMPENVPMEIPSTEEQVHTTDEVFPHICQYCTKGFRGTYELDNHIRSRHTTERPFECPQCHKKFATLSFLRNHTRLHTGQRPYKCPHCPEEFTLWSSIKAHISEHEGSQSNKSTKQFRCDQCAASFREHFGLRMHKQLKHRISNTIADAQSRTPYDSLPNSVLEENNAQDANYCCDICKKTFKYRYAYTNHKRAHIRALRTYHCPYSQCSQVFQTELKLRQHTLTHKSDWPYQCKQCIKGFYKKSQLTNHMRDSHSGDRIECSQCQQKFASKASLRVHINIFHSEDFHHLSTAPQMEQANDLQRPIKTEVPDSNLPHESLLVEQIQTRNSPHESLLVEQILPDQDFVGPEPTPAHTLYGQEQTTNFNGPAKPAKQRKPKKKAKAKQPMYKPKGMISHRCRWCPIAFREQHKMMQHMQQKHKKRLMESSILEQANEPETNQKEPETTAQTMPTENEIKEEIDPQPTEKSISVPGKSTKSHKCSVCGEVFTARFKYIQHIHAHKPPLKCKECSKQFNSYAQLRIHSSLHKGVRFQCSQCPNSYSRKDNLAKHMGTHKFSHVCQYCTKEFRGNYELNNHIRNCHTSERPFQCPHCPKKFAIMDYLGKHIRIHSGERPFKCPHCPKSYTLSSSLSGHIRKHHGNSRNLITKQFRCNQCLASFREYFKLRMHKQLKHCINDTMAKAKSLGKLKQSSTNYPGTNTCNVSLPNLVLEEGNLEIKKEPAEEDTEPTPNQSQQPDTNYSCEICDKKFKYSYAYNNHIRTHMRRQQFKCSQCQRTFVSKQSRNLHISIVHSAAVKDLSKGQTNDHQRPIKTEVPDTNSPHESLLVEQILPDQDYECPEPTTTRILYGHKQSGSLNGPAKPAKQRKTAKKAKAKKSIYKPKGMINYRCRWCPIAFRDQHKMMQHMQQKHKKRLMESSIDKQVIEPKTNQKDPLIPSQTKLAEIEIKEEFDPQTTVKKVSRPKKFTKSHKCSVCGDIFTAKFKYVQHIHTHQPPLNCKDCPKQFNSYAQLRVHLKTHRGVRFQCAYCPNSYSRKHNLAKHMDIHKMKGDIIHSAENTDTDPVEDEMLGQTKSEFMCELCSKSFYHEYNLRLHKLMKHGIKDDEEREEELILDHQPMNFGLDHETNIPLRNRPGDGAYEELEFEDSDSKKDILNPNPILIPQTHIQLPNVEKNVTKNNVCPYCLKRYVRKESLTVHMRRHTGERPYKCPYCVMSFSSNDSYKRHLRGHTGDLFRCDKCPKVYKCRSDLRFHQNQKHKVPKEEPIVLTKHLIVRLKRIKLPVSVKVEPIA
ncbi:zinc finger protein 62 homolog [Drosophila willistoni]|uniref:zinc finger protein 62 homolog n=1 Tax=Drosophila willistoni TaxID=7260 RepID=UPI000C26CF50|nr:zinc finger protein 62 homolog [Drosophila willistoni]